MKKGGPGGGTSEKTFLRLTSEVREVRRRKVKTVREYKEKGRRKISGIVENSVRRGEV